VKLTIWQKLLTAGALSALPSIIAMVFISVADDAQRDFSRKEQVGIAFLAPVHKAEVELVHLGKVAAAARAGQIGARDALDEQVGRVDKIFEDVSARELL
jgi:hypothetical protein